MQEIKNITGIVAVLLAFASYIPYLRDTISGKTKPHIYSWFLWGLESMIAFGLQVSGNAGIGSLVTLSVGIICFIIVFLGLRNGQKDITKSDKFFFVAALISVIVWVFVKQPVISVVLVTTTSILGFVPTVRKSWNAPHSETLITYAINGLRHFLSVLALTKYSLLTWLYPGAWVFANGFFCLMLIIRRREVR